MNEPYDLIVIGGGINGAAIARDAAMRGLKVVLLEKNDFGFGASSKTSKLAHGGVRYLAQFHFSLVKESLKERGLLLKNAPHLVKPLEFVMPVYSEDPRPLWQIDLGLYIYDYLSNGALPRHRKLNVNQIAAEFPGIKMEQLKGGCSFYDAQMQDSRILIENVLSAESYGVDIKNYTEVKELLKEDDKIIGVTCKNRFNETIENIYGYAIVNTTGVWSENISSLGSDENYPKVFPTKGVHLVLPKFISEKALLLHSPIDKRVFFVIPWENHTLVGTTDTIYNGDRDHVQLENEDTVYLLNSLNHYFPEIKFNKTSVITSFVGLRPLVNLGSSPNSPSDIARDHVIHISKGGLVTVLGGKYTTHRKVAEIVVDQITKKIKKDTNACKTEHMPLPGAFKEENLQDLRKCFENVDLNKAQIDHLLSTYGALSLKILKIVEEDSSLKSPISDQYPHLIAELVYAIRFEHTKTVEDWIYRRMNFGNSEFLNNEYKKRVSEIFANYLQ